MERSITRGSGEWHSVCGRPYLPPFSLLYNIVCGPEFHISGICLRRRYTQAYLPPHRAAHHWSNISAFEKQFKEGSSLASFAANPILLVLAQGS